MRIMGTVKGIAAIGACFVCGMFAYALTRSPVFDGKDYELYTGTSWGQADNYELCLDSGKIGMEGCVNMIAQLFQHT